MLHNNQTKKKVNSMHIWYIITTNRNTIYWTYSGNYEGYTDFANEVNRRYGTSFNAGNVLWSEISADQIVNRNDSARVYFV